MPARITRRQLDRPAEEGLGLCERAAVQQQLSKSAVCIEMLRVTLDGRPVLYFCPAVVLPMVLKQAAYRL